MKVQTHKDLKVWQESKVLVSDIYKLTSNFPREELYALTGQLKRTAISIPSNIAEGAARASNREYIQFLYIALGSAAELDTQIEIAYDLGFLESEDYTRISQRIDEIGKMLSGLISYRKRKLTKPLT